MINWAHFPRSTKPTPLALQVVGAFEDSLVHIDSSVHTLPSNAVLGHVGPLLEVLGFRTETGKKKDQKVHVPVLYGNNGRIAKAFEADAHHVAEGFVVEIEAGRGVINNQFLKDLFQACMMDEVNQLAIAIRNIYTAAGINNNDFNRVVTFFDTLYASDRLKLPLRGILVVGY